MYSKFGLRHLLDSAVVDILYGLFFPGGGEEEERERVKCVTPTYVYIVEIGFCLYNEMV